MVVQLLAIDFREVWYKEFEQPFKNLSNEIVVSIRHFHFPAWPIKAFKRSGSSEMRLAMDTITSMTPIYLPETEKAIFISRCKKTHVKQCERCISIAGCVTAKMKDSRRKKRFEISRLARVP